MIQFFIAFCIAFIAFVLGILLTKKYYQKMTRSRSILKEKGNTPPRLLIKLSMVKGDNPTFLVGNSNEVFSYIRTCLEGNVFPDMAFELEKSNEVKTINNSFYSINIGEEGKKIVKLIPESNLATPYPFKGVTPEQVAQQPNFDGIIFYNESKKQIICLSSIEVKSSIQPEESLLTVKVLVYVYDEEEKMWIIEGTKVPKKPTPPPSPEPSPEPEEPKENDDPKLDPIWQKWERWYDGNGDYTDISHTPGAVTGVFHQIEFNGGKYASGSGGFRNHSAMDYQFPVPGVLKDFIQAEDLLFIYPEIHYSDPGNNRSEEDRIKNAIRTLHKEWLNDIYTFSDEWGIRYIN